MASQQLWDALNYLSENLKVFAPIKAEITQLIEENEVLKQENTELKQKHESIKNEVKETQGMVNELILITMGAGE